MSLLAPTVGEIELIKIMINKVAATNVRLHLYSNNYTPTATTALTELVESTGTGYVSVVLTGSSWVVSTDSTTVATYAQQTFIYIGADTIYGYYITSNASTALLWAELSAGAPYSIPAGGGSIKVTPTIELKST